jgi:hypothetical protein
MRCRNLAFITAIVILLLLSGCSKAECKKDTDCVKEFFTAKCVDKKCAYTPIPNKCGNLDCEEAAKENKCSCPADCGKCEGTVGKYLENMCNEKKDACVQLIPASKQKPITMTKELSTGGSKINVITNFKQPFNTKRDQFELEFGVNVMSSAMSDLKINRLELTGMTPDKRTIQLADKTVDRNLFEGGKLKEKLTIDFPTSEKDGELSNLNLKIYVDYVTTSGTTSTPKSETLSSSYQSLKFQWAMPEMSPGCPVCEKIQGMKEECSEATNYFCSYTPIPGACGNGICDGSENQCICPADCGPCTGGGTFTTRSCSANKCIAQLRSGVSVKPQSLFDDRDVGAFRLQNTYKYNSPFNTKSDKFTLEFTLYEKQDTVGPVTLKDIRLLEGSQEIAMITAGKTLSSIGQKETVELTVPAGAQPEQSRSVSMRIWYEYTQNNETKLNDYTKELGKITILSPDV